MTNLEVQSTSGSGVVSTHPQSTATHQPISSMACANGSRASGMTQPPRRHEIAAFMLKYSAHLPQPTYDPMSDTLLTAPRLVAPYLYTGADYALVLAACFPSRCIDLTSLNWSAHPLASQRLGNLRVFCEAARRLALPDAPLSALQPTLLQCSPACVVAHLKVQHWLYSLSLRFTPPPQHDAAALRVVHRHLQLGEPLLKRPRAEAEETSGGVACSSLHACAPLSATDLQRCCAAALAPLPPFLSASVDTVGSDGAATAAGTLSKGEKGSDSERGKGASGGPSSATNKEDADTAAHAAKQKPWLNYSKPWLLPSLRAAEAKKAASEAAAARRAQEERERNPRYTAFAAQSRDVQEQYAVSKTAAAAKRTQLHAVKAFVLQEVMEGRVLDFKELAERLREQC